MSSPTDDLLCSWAAGIVEWRRDCACYACIDAVRKRDEEFKVKAEPLERALNEASPKMMASHLLTGNVTIEETERPIGFTVRDDLTEAELIEAYAKHVLKICDGNKTKAARILGIDRRSMYRRLGIR